MDEKTSKAIKRRIRRSNEKEMKLMKKVCEKLWRRENEME